MVGKEDVAVRPADARAGPKPRLSREENLFVGLLACKGFSQQIALMYLNMKCGLADFVASEFARRSTDLHRVFARLRR